MFPRTVQLEHPEPCALVKEYCPPSSEETYVVWLPSESVTCTVKATVNKGPWPVMPPTVTITGPVAAPSGRTATICVSLQLVIVVAAAPLNHTVLVPWVAPNPEPEIVTDA